MNGTEEMEKPQDERIYNLPVVETADGKGMVLHAKVWDLDLCAEAEDCTELMVYSENFLNPDSKCSEDHEVRVIIPTELLSKFGIMPNSIIKIVISKAN